MKQIIKIFPLVLVSLSVPLFTSSCKNDLKPQEQEVDFSISYTPLQAQMKRERQMMITQLLVAEQEVEHPRPTKYNVSLTYDETIDMLLLLGRSVQSGASIPLAFLTNLNLTYQAKGLVGNKVKVTITNDALKTANEETVWTVNADGIYNVETLQEGEGEFVVRGAKSLKRIPAGTELTVSVTPVDGRELVALTANDVDVPKSKAFKVTGNMTIRTTFTKRALTTYVVTLTKEDEGKVVISGVDNSGAVVAGAKLAVTTTPTDDWDLVTLTANGADTLPSKTFVVYNPTEVRAILTKKAPTTYVVTLTREGEGKVVITGADSLGAARAGTELTVTAVPVSGWELTVLTANEADILSNKTSIVHNPTEICATFTKKTPKTCGVMLTREGKGKVVIIGADNLGVVRAGTKLAATAILVIGWGIESTMTNGKGITAEKGFMVTSNIIVEAVFTIRTYPVTFMREGDGKALILEVDNLGAATLSSRLTIVAEPCSGRGVKDITTNGKDITTNKAFAVNGITDVSVIFYKVPGSRVVVRCDPTEIIGTSLNDLPPPMISDGPSLHIIPVRMDDGVKLSIRAKDGYRTTFVTSDPSGFFHPARKTSNETEYLTNTSKHREVEASVHCTRQSWTLITM